MHKGLLLAAALSGFAAADETWTINASSNWGTWEGWGVSLAWWAKAFGNRDDLADMLFSLDNTTFSSKRVPGLGFNIARYNAGACSSNTYNGTSMSVPSTMKKSRQIDGFWWDWASKDPSSSSWVRFARVIQSARISFMLLRPPEPSAGNLSHASNISP